MNQKLLIALGLMALLAGAKADTVTGTATTFGAASGSGPWDITTGSMPAYSGVDITPVQTFTFSQLTDIDAVFTSISGGADQGSPRILVGLQDGANEEFVNIALGDPPDFIDTSSQLTADSGFNVIGTPNSDNRYDLSQGLGGSSTTNYSAALALVGGLTVDDIIFVADYVNPAGPPYQDITLDSLNADYNVPDQGATLAFLVIGLGAIGIGPLVKRLI